MKRVFLMLCLALFPLCLTSCRVRWFGQMLEAPWWIVALPVLLFSAVALYLAGRAVAHTRFVCPHCYKTFHPKPWAAVFSFHVNEAHVLRCPHCGNKDLCSPSCDQ
ncbi:MAG: hypothetical protein IJY12_02140 [Clostridia bacterium]|nr:hypothetical protein [Clostridia bacterium]